MKKILLCIISIIFLIILIIGISLKNKNPYILKESKINKYLNNYIDYDFEIVGDFKNKVYGTIYDVNIDQTLFGTKYLFIYDYNKDMFQIIEPNDNSRIIDFTILQGKLFYIKLLRKNDTVFRWELHSSTIDDSRIKSNVIADGEIINMFNYPRIKKLNNNQFVLFSIRDNNNNEYYQIDIYDYISGKINLLSGKGNLSTNDGEILYNFTNSKIYNNKIYYTILDANNNQILFEYNIKESTTHQIYINTDNNYLLYNYEIVDKYYYLQLIDKSSTDKSKVLILDNMYNIIKTEAAKVRTFNEELDNTCIIFHSEGNIWEKYYANQNEYKKFNIPLKNILPKYFLLNNMLIIQDFDNQFYEIKVSC